MKKLVLLIGDTIIDKYVYLQPTGFSLETPTIKCQKIREYQSLGGAANVAIKMSQLGCDVDFVTSVSDEHRKILETNPGINVICSGKRDQIKERFYLVKDASYKYLQINDCMPIEPTTVWTSHRKMPTYDLIVVSDYRLGVVSDQILKILPKNKTICQMQVSDSSESIKKYLGFHCFVGNENEVPKKDIEHILRQNMFDVCVATDGKDEIIACSENKKIVHKPRAIDDVSDYHGAGDAFFAGFCATYNGKNLHDAIVFGDTTAYNYLRRAENVK
tara:strand:- start:16090 stop:16911 length:822 start_codon:yes stop_codon:yes gene_type:complete